MASSPNTTHLRQTIEEAVRAAHANGESYHDILADISTVLGCMVAAGSRDRRTRLACVKASFSVVEKIISKDLN
ncbi:hypothetical protein [Sphingobium yanoikuyae]|uniref:hypothetical protein n=1 Tax=Sphingobium yanoikuyae TaxID=13690 RepID=UPI00345EA621